MRYLLIIFTLSFAISLAPPGSSEASSKGATVDASRGDGLKKRIDFGDSYITGQSIKSGAVYLLQRKPSEIKSMLSYRETYRSEILKNFSVMESPSANRSGAFLKSRAGER